jgi:hypothetical protein
VRNPGDLRVLENRRLASDITRELALTVTVDLRFDSYPPDGIAGVDTALQAGGRIRTDHPTRVGVWRMNGTHGSLNIVREPDSEDGRR